MQKPLDVEQKLRKTGNPYFCCAKSRGPHFAEVPAHGAAATEGPDAETLIFTAPNDPSLARKTPYPNGLGRHFVRLAGGIHSLSQIIINIPAATGGLIGSEFYFIYKVCFLSCLLFSSLSCGSPLFVSDLFLISLFSDCFSLLSLPLLLFCCSLSLSLSFS